MSILRSNVITNNTCGFVFLIPISIRTSSRAEVLINAHLFSTPRHGGKIQQSEEDPGQQRRRKRRAATAAAPEVRPGVEGLGLVGLGAPFLNSEQTGRRRR